MNLKLVKAFHTDFKIWGFINLYYSEKRHSRLWENLRFIMN